MARQQKLIFKAEYEPDMERMVRALRLLLEYQPLNERGNSDVVDISPTHLGGSCGDEHLSRAANN